MAIGDKADIKEVEAIEELTGKMSSDFSDKKMMHSALERDTDTISDGKMILESVNQGLSGFTADQLFEDLVNNYKLAKQIYGETFLREATGMDIDQLGKNLRFPEFKRKLKKALQTKFDKLKDKKLLDYEDQLTERAYELAAISLYIEELDQLIPESLTGEKKLKKFSHEGMRENVRMFKKSDRYRDIAVRKSLKLAIRRGHKNLISSDLVIHERTIRGRTTIVYALDASGSMKGAKIKNCKKAGIALAYKAISEKDRVGLVVFGSEVKAVVEPTDNFPSLLKNIAMVRAARETNFSATIKKASELFKSDSSTKHLMIISDAVPTAGSRPEEDALEAASEARSLGITISIVGIDLDKKGEVLAKRLVQIGSGRLYAVRDLEKLDRLVLADYYSLYNT